MSKSIPDGDLKERVARVVAEEVAPLLQMDGNEIEVLAIEDGVVQVRCAGRAAAVRAACRRSSWASRTSCAAASRRSNISKRCRKGSFSLPPCGGG